jgi:glycosyltransferase involved in cell wall biosynthesis
MAFCLNVAITLTLALREWDNPQMARGKLWRAHSSWSGRIMQNSTSAIEPRPDARLGPSQDPQQSRLGISVVVPVYNEEQSLRPLYDALTAALEHLGQSYEIVFVDDGSRDGSFATLEALHTQDSRIRVIRFRRNFGKTPALVAGFSHARGSIVFTMDADLQDDAEEMSKFLAKLDEGYDLVSGWKYPRHDPVSKTFPSFFFNRMVSFSTGVRLHDINCGFKAYRHEVLEDVKLYGELHRFVPVLAHQRGFRVTEVKVRHHKRKFGKSK